MNFITYKNLVDKYNRSIDSSIQEIDIRIDLIVIKIR